MIALLSRLFSRDSRGLARDLLFVARDRDRWLRTATMWAARAGELAAQNRCQQENVGFAVGKAEELRAEVARLRRRLADRCVGFDAHPDARYADYCVAPVYVGDKPTTCDMPRDAHRSAP